jgi:hypothetical protein
VWSREVDEDLLNEIQDVLWKIFFSEEVRALPVMFRKKFLHYALRDDNHDAGFFILVANFCWTQLAVVLDLSN